jgi:hypothetical protein
MIPKGDFKVTLTNLRVTTDALKTEMPQIMKDAQVAVQQGSNLFSQLNQRDAELWKSLAHFEQFPRT